MQGRICEACNKGQSQRKGGITRFMGYWLHVKCAKEFLKTHPIPKPKEEK